MCVCVCSSVHKSYEKSRVSDTRKRFFDSTVDKFQRVFFPAEFFRRNEKKKKKKLPSPADRIVASVKLLAELAG